MDSCLLMYSRRMNGFTIIELMVAMVLSLFLLAGVATLYLNTFIAQRESSDMVLLNHNARSALAIASGDLKSAGFANGVAAGSISSAGYTVTDDCTGLASATQPFPSFLAGRGGNNILDCAVGQAGNYTAADGKPADWFLFKGTAGSLTTALAATGNYLVANSQEGRVFRGTNAPDLSPDQEIREYQFSLFYLANNELRLLRLDNDALVDTTLASNIEAMRVELGIDENGDGQVNRHQSVPADISNWSAGQWNQVQSVKIHLLARSPETNNYTDNRTYTMGDITVKGGGDNRHRHLVSTTVFLYNHAYQ
ncbi:PilW family protein [uncultured Endozoicomonas sp.]|uniref:PilW family protein n=1 Tax=uncultured Endozoicomonas sp. TaxID=432652 RepID=UPI0026260B29|nr:PilW family protein [uncultured Endozoicomonas sp.]